MTGLVFVKVPAAVGVLTNSIAGCWWGHQQRPVMEHVISRSDSDVAFHAGLIRLVSALRSRLGAPNRSPRWRSR